MARFVVIDDDNTIRKLMAVTLESVGHVVAQAATGHEGAAIFETFQPDVLITDIVMPEESIESVIELKRQHPTVPFVVVSGLSAQSPRSVEVTRLLAARTLPKPFRLPDFIALTDEVLTGLNIPLPSVAAKR